MSSLRTYSRSPDWLNVFSWSSRRLVPSLLLGPHLPTDVANLLSSAFRETGFLRAETEGSKSAPGGRSLRGDRTAYVKAAMPNAVPGNGNSRPETKAPKRPHKSNYPSVETARPRKMPPNRDHLRAAELSGPRGCGPLIDREKAKRQNARCMPLAVSAPLIGKFSALTS
jgi:hypothetical protein